MGLMVATPVDDHISRNIIMTHGQNVPQCEAVVRQTEMLNISSCPAVHAPPCSTKLDTILLANALHAARFCRADKSACYSSTVCGRSSRIAGCILG
jgi:hypothetical protein